MPVVAQSATWDGRVVFGSAGTDGECRAMSVRPNLVDRNAGGLQFVPAVFSQGAACPTALGSHAIAAAPEFAENPFPSDADGQPVVGGDHLTYQLQIVDSTDGQLTMRRAMAIVSAPHTDASEVVRLDWLGDATALQSSTGNPLLGTEPTVTADGRLLVYQSSQGNLVYARLGGAAVSEPRSLTELFTEANVDIDGLTLAERYPLAAAQLRGSDGQLLAAGADYPGAHPWISQDGTELFHTAVQVGDEELEGRHGAVSVIGQATGHALRHIDGPINPSRAGLDGMRVGNVGLGRSKSPWAPFAAEGRVLPTPHRAATYPMFGTLADEAGQRGTYHEVDFEVFTDRDYLVYLPMNENIGIGNDFTYDLEHTPDVSGNFNTAELGSGAQFAVEQFGEDDNAGAVGRAIFFSPEGVVRVPASASLVSPAQGLTASLFVQRMTDDAQTLLQWPGVCSMTVDANGTVEATVFVGGAPRSVTSSAGLAEGEWAHVGFTYERNRGRVRVYVDGAMAGEASFGAGILDMPTGDLLVGPGASGGSGDDVVLGLDEVAISRVARFPDEFVWAAQGVEPQSPATGGAELLGSVALPLGLDPSELIIPNWAPLREDIVALGQVLFFDPRLSRDGSISCATCHDPELAFTDGRAVGLGIDDTVLGRATPTIFNRAMSTAQFWDGRSRSVESQALSPIGSPPEMDLPLDEAIARLASSPGYVELFQAAFGRGPDRGAVANAIAQFERSQLAGDSRVDRFENGEVDALTAAEQRGRVLFHGKARCVACHSGSNYTDEGFHDIGLIEHTDAGRFYVSGGRAKFMQAFKTPSLRNIAVTGPYFHNGAAETLEAVVELYSDGPSGQTHDPESRPLGLTASEQADLVAFLGALTSPNAVQVMDVELPEMPGF